MLSAEFVESVVKVHYIYKTHHNKTCLKAYVDGTCANQTAKSYRLVRVCAVCHNVVVVFFFFFFL